MGGLTSLFSFLTYMKALGRGPVTGTSIRLRVSQLQERVLGRKINVLIWRNHITVDTGLSNCIDHSREARMLQW